MLRRRSWVFTAANGSSEAGNTNIEYHSCEDHKHAPNGPLHSWIKLSCFQEIFGLERGLGRNGEYEMGRAIRWWCMGSIAKIYADDAEGERGVYEGVGW